MDRFVVPNPKPSTDSSDGGLLLRTGRERMSMNPFGSKAIREEDEEDFRDGASTPETVDEDLDGFQKDAADPGAAAAMATKTDTGTTFEMTVNHSKLLVLISKYAQVALTAEDQETWLRQLSLYVLL
jgi:hypothetical protein